MTTTTKQNNDIKLLASYFNKPVQDSHIYAPLANKMFDYMVKTYGRTQANKMADAADKLAAK